MNELYYRVYRTSDGSVKVVCMQDHDEYDYDQSRFLTTIKFKSEKGAERWIEKTLNTAALILRGRPQ